jgi:hypothetical protein
VKYKVAFFLAEVVRYSARDSIVYFSLLGDDMKVAERLLVFVLLLGYTLGCMNFAVAQDAHTQKTVVVRAGRLLDVKSGKVLSDQTIIIHGDRIASVGALGDQKLPPDATVIDLSNATVLPGLIDAHTHLTFTTNFGYSRLGISIPREALNGVA